MAPSDLRLPLNVTGQAEVARMQRELGKIDDFFVSAAKRQPGTSITPPRITRVLEELAKINKVNLLEAKARKDLSEALAGLLSQAPSLNISFAADPSPKALDTLIIWFRENIHPQTLLSVGLQPNIAAGCVLRTPNKIFDLSLKEKLKGQESYLAKLIDGALRG